MKRTFTIHLSLCFILISALTSCEKPIDNNPGRVHAASDASQRALLLNEGSWGRNDASITLIDNLHDTLYNNWFETANGRGLGDIAQDIIIYGNRAYATVTFSNSLEVINTTTGQSTRIDLGDRTPRYLTAADGKLFVSCYRPHSVIKIDTATLEIENMCILGAFNPEGIAAIGNRLFVASSYVQTSNSGYRYDSILYVLDASAMRIDTTITVGINPQCVLAIDDNHLAVNYSGDHTGEFSGTAIVNATTLRVSQLNLPFTGIYTANGILYGFCRNGYTQESTATYHRIDPTTLSDITLHISCNTPYGISVDPCNGDIYIFSDGNYTATGDIICHAANGTQRWQVTAGMLPRKAVFIQ